MAPCPFCRGDIEIDAIKCRHCLQIVNAEFRVERARRRRAYVNYASWVFYLFGLIAFLIFRPVGLIAIGTGFLLSIAYYAIPVHRSSSEKRPLPRLGDVVSALFRFERVPISLPHLPKLRFVLVGTPLLAALFGYLINFMLLQRPMNDVLRQNASLRGMQVSTHYLHWVIPGVMVYDLKGVSERQSRLDVHVALVEYAGRMRHRAFSQIDLMYRGEKKFTIDGDSFRKLGTEYQRKNYAFVLFEFPRMVASSLDGDDSAGARENADALIRFHDAWYGKEIMRETLSAGRGTAGSRAPPESAADPPSRESETR
ncbi:MAG TPA: hypothetical protein VMT00_14485 [Thermoanaerobaculia bacterium]|nr:hypothetical protein [Thermoanaerobaculia bacterium]